MTNREYYTYNHIEFDGEFNKELAANPVATDRYGWIETVEVIDPRTAVAEIDKLQGKFMKESYRDGGSFDISSGPITWEFRIADYGRYTEEGFLKYKPFVKKITYKKRGE